MKIRPQKQAYQLISLFLTTTHLVEGFSRHGIQFKYIYTTANKMYFYQRVNMLSK